VREKERDSGDCQRGGGCPGGERGDGERDGVRAAAGTGERHGGAARRGG
jgi:hypothetical protein